MLTKGWVAAITSAQRSKSKVEHLKLILRYKVLLLLADSSPDSKYLLLPLKTSFHEGANCLGHNPKFVYLTTSHF